MTTPVRVGVDERWMEYNTDLTVEVAVWVEVDDAVGMAVSVNRVISEMGAFDVATSSTVEVVVGVSPSACAIVSNDPAGRGKNTTNRAADMTTAAMMIHCFFIYPQ